LSAIQTPGTSGPGAIQISGGEFAKLRLRKFAACARRRITMGYRVYGEPESKESLLGDFLIGFYLGSIGFYFGGAWVLVSLGWVAAGTMLWICIGLGLTVGSMLAWSSWRRKKKENVKLQKKGTL